MNSIDRIWVGRITKTGSILVYDADLQIKKSSLIYVYSLLQGLVRRFEASKLRLIIEPIHGEEKANAILVYKTWKIAHEEDFLKNEHLRLIKESEKIEASKVLIQKSHQNRLIGLGYNPNFIGSQSIEKRNLRVTHCYNCKEMLDNNIFIECTKCNWIICTCGACGCGYSS